MVSCTVALSASIQAPLHGARFEEGLLCTHPASCLQRTQLLDTFQVDWLPTLPAAILLYVGYVSWHESPVFRPQAKLPFKWQPGLRLAHHGRCQGRAGIDAAGLCVECSRQQVDVSGC